MVDCINKNHTEKPKRSFLPAHLIFVQMGESSRNVLYQYKKIKKLFQNLLTKRYNTVIINVTVLYIAFRRENNG